MRVWWLIVASALCTQEILGSRVLILTPVAFKSHTIFYRGLAKSLVQHGHEVTQVLPFNKSAAAGAREVVLPLPDIMDNMDSIFKHGMTSFMKFASKRMPEMCFQALASEEFTEIRKENFDVVIYSDWGSYCFYEYISTLKVPFILTQALGMEFSYQALSIGNPFFPSFVPHIFLGHSPSPHGLSYWQRLKEIAIDGVFTLGDYANLKFVMPNELKARGFCTNECPDLYTTRTTASLFIINSIKTLESVAKPYVPAVIHAGGLHITEAKPLPHELEQWVAGAGEEGFILFSLGTVVKSSDMSENTRKILVNVLGSLKQRVLWKWEKDQMEDLPSNVRISKWLPQQDILGHPKLQLFMTHGGLHSTQEALYNGVPVLGFPVFADQNMNMIGIEKRGWGRVINWEELTEEYLREALLDIINNHRYRAEAQRQARIAKDQPISPQDTVNYWVDYIIRHDGAKHLDCPIKWMPWYKLYNVDVWIFLIASLILTLGIILKLLICTYNCCRRQVKNKTD